MTVWPVVAYEIGLFRETWPYDFARKQQTWQTSQMVQTNRQYINCVPDHVYAPPSRVDNPLFIIHMYLPVTRPRNLITHPPTPLLHNTKRIIQTQPLPLGRQMPVCSRQTWSTPSWHPARPDSQARVGSRPSERSKIAAIAWRSPQSTLTSHNSGIL